MKVKMGFQLKDEGNASFKSKNYKEAIRSYYKSILYIKGLMGPDDECFMYAKADMRVSQEQLEEMRNLYNILYLNMAQCHLNLGNFKKALENSEKALKLKETSKGLYRRGLAELELRDFDAAIADFEAFQRMEPENEEVKLLIAKGKEGAKTCDKALASALKGAFN